MTKGSLVIVTKQSGNCLKNYNSILEMLMSNFICSDDKIVDIRYEAETQDYIRKISEVEAFYKDLNIDTFIKEQYNKSRNKSSYYDKERIEEHYSCEYKSNYFNEIDICHTKVVNFSTAEYYNDCIGRVIIDIATNYFNSDIKIKSSNINEIINSLKDKQYEILISSLSDEYKDKLL